MEESHPDDARTDQYAAQTVAISRISSASNKSEDGIEQRMHGTLRQIPSVREYFRIDDEPDPEDLCEHAKEKNRALEELISNRRISVYSSLFEQR